MPTRSQKKIFYPELHDASWVREHEALGADGISLLLGCAVRTAQNALWDAGVFILPRWKGRWNQVEVCLLKALYPHPCSRAILLGEMLGRTECAIFKKAPKLGVQSDRRWRHRRVAPSERAQFLQIWRAAIQRNLPTWLQDGHREEALSLTWRPALQIQHCECCPYDKRWCRGSTRAFCERVSVRDWMDGRMDGIHLMAEEDL